MWINKMNSLININLDKLDFKIHNDEKESNKKNNAIMKINTNNFKCVVELNNEVEKNNFIEIFGIRLDFSKDIGILHQFLEVYEIFYFF